jgi:hypothetical protein
MLTKVIGEKVTYLSPHKFFALALLRCIAGGVPLQREAVSLTNNGYGSGAMVE